MPDAAPPDASPLWTLSNVSLGRRISVLSLRIRPGVTAILGPSGSGKTSLLNLLVGFEAASAGGIERTFPDGRAGLPLFWSAQDGGLWRHLTVREHLERVAPPGTQPSEIGALLEAFDLSGRARAHPDLLSQGERSRLSVARALAAAPRVLVLDEPLAHVDAARRTAGWAAIRERLARTNASLVFSTHESGSVLAEAARVVVLREGRVVHEGAVADCYWRPPTAEVAESLGEANWLTPEEAARWLGRSVSSCVCLRPEQTGISRAPEGRAVVEETRFCGAVEEVELRHEPTGIHRRFFHRPPGPLLARGDRVGVRALLALLFASFLALAAGCGRSDAQDIPLKPAPDWHLPPEGNRLPAPRSLAVGPKDSILALDTGGRVFVFDADGTLTRDWRMPESKAGNPEGICVLSDGRIAVGDTHYHRVLFFDAQGRVTGSFGREGTGPGEFLYPVDVAEDVAGNLYVSEYGGNDRIQKFTKDGKFMLAFGGFGTKPGQFQRPQALVWRQGKIYVADAVNGRIQVFSDAGAFEGILAPPGGDLRLDLPYDIVVGPDGCLWTIEYGPARVSRIGFDGRLLGRFGGLGSDPGQFKTPWGLAVDSKGRVRVADTGNRRISDLRP